MKRMKVMFGQRRIMILATLAILVLAAAALAASSASFTATSANPSNVFTAGNLKHFNSKDGVAILGATKMVPGQTTAGTVVITNTGDLDGKFSMHNSHAVDLVSPTAPATPFVGLLTVKIYETKVAPVAGAKTQIYGGAAGAALSADPALDLGTWVPGESRQYDFEVTFPDGTPAHDNLYKLASASVEYDWTSAQ